MRVTTHLAKFLRFSCKQMVSLLFSSKQPVFLSIFTIPGYFSSVCFILGQQSTNQGLLSLIKIRFPIRLINQSAQLDMRQVNLKRNHSLIDQLFIKNYHQYEFPHVQYQMSLDEHQYIEVDLPNFIIKFKEICLSHIIPFIDSCIQYIENAESPLIFLLLILIFIQLLRTVLVKAPTQNKHEVSTTETRQINKEIKDLRKQLKSIQAMLVQLKSSNLERGRTNVTGNQQTSRIINLCKDSWEKREAIASEIMDWQLKIIKEVTKLKNKNRSSRSPSKHQATSSKQLSAQSKKSITSMIIPPENHVPQHSKNLFISQIKSKDRVLQPKIQEEKQSQIIEETVINVKLENQSINGTKMPSIDISVHQIKRENEHQIKRENEHQIKRENENEAAEAYKQVVINPPLQQQLTEEKVEQLEDPFPTVPPVLRQAPFIPKMPVNLPRPPTINKKDTKRGPPPPFKAPPVK